MIRRLILVGLVALFPALAFAQMAVIAPTPPNGDNSNRIATTAFVAAGGGSGTPTGPAGGGLTGTYPNPTVATVPATALPAFTGDATSSAGTAALTLATVNANVGAFGSATSCVTVTNNAKGLTTAISAAACTPPIGSITGLGTGVATALAANTNVSGGIITPTPTRAGDIVYWNGSAWVTLAGNNSGTQVLQETSAGVPSWVAGGSGTVTSITPGAGIVSSVTAACSQTAVTTTGTLSAANCINAQVGTTYTIVDGDRSKTITATNAAAQAYSIAQAGAASAFQSGWYVDIENNSTNVAGIVTITPTTSTICAQGTCAATYKIQPGQFARIISDGTNYQVTLNPTTPSTWTPTDGSGAGLAFTGVSANWQRIGNMVFAYATLTYPGTADASASKIAGFPVAAANAGYAEQCTLSYSNTPTLKFMKMTLNTTTAAFFVAAGTAILNSASSGGTVNFICIYPAI
jgi:hypothetical protein